MSWQEGHGHKCVLAWTWHSGLSSAKKKKPFMGREQGWVKVELCGLSSRASLGGAKKLKC